MNEFEYDEYEEMNKIPYDQRPITRTSYYSKPRERSSSTRGTSNILKYVVALLVIVNVVMGALIASLYIKVKQPTVINNPTYNITSSGDNAAWAAASKAKFSTVCVAAGLTSNNYQSFFSSSGVSRGAGVIVEHNALTGEAVIVTCYHVVKTSINFIYVLAYDSFEPVKATMVGYSSDSDIAVLRVGPNDALKTSNCCAADIGDSSSLTEGELAVAIGNPLSMGFSVTVGVVSSPLNQVSVEGTATRVIKVDAAINAGNSGGGLFDGEGKLIGIVNAKFMSNEIDSVGFAIPSNLAMAIKKSVIRNNGNPTIANFDYGTVEILKSGNVINPDTQKLEYSVVVSSISLVSDAYNLGNGLKSGDRIISVSASGVTRRVINLHDINDTLIGLKAGDQITFVVERDAVQKTFVFNIDGDVAIS